MRPLRITHYCTKAFGSSDGVTTALAGWAEAQASAGDHVTILGAPGSASRPQAYSPLVTTSAVPHIGSGRMTSAPRGLGAQLAAQDLLVLHTPWSSAGIIAAEDARRLAVPYIVMPHGSYDTAAGSRRFEAARAVAERRLLRRAAAIHLFFDSEQQHVERYAPTTRCLIAPTGWDLPAARWSGGDDRLLWIGRYSVKHKGLDLLLRALARLPAATRPRLAMFGEDYLGQRATVEELVEQLGLRRWVSVGNPVYGDKKTELLLSCGGYVHPARWDAQGLALVEALSYGVPVLALSSIHMANELVNWRAAIVSAPSVGDLAKGLSGLASGVPSVGKRGRDYVKDRLNWNRVIAEFHEQLTHIL